MIFDDLHRSIPYVTGNELYTVEKDIYPEVQIRMPGRHQNDTEIPGGDFVVLVTDDTCGWKQHPFTHDDIFNDISKKTKENQACADALMNDYASVVFGADPNSFSTGYVWKDSMSSHAFLRAIQCLAVAEHRRYGRYERRGGGRYLPARFASGIVEGLWTAADCKKVQRMGRPGVELLENKNGKPVPLKERA